MPAIPCMQHHNTSHVNAQATRTRPTQPPTLCALNWLGFCGRGCVRITPLTSLTSHVPDSRHTKSICCWLAPTPLAPACTIWTTWHPWSRWVAGVVVLHHTASHRTQTNFGAHGYGAMFSLSVMDRHYKPGMTLDEAKALLRLCVDEVRMQLLCRIASRHIIAGPPASAGANARVHCARCRRCRHPRCPARVGPSRPVQADTGCSVSCACLNHITTSITWTAQFCPAALQCERPCACTSVAG